MNDELWLGIDIGTQGVRAAVYDDEGRSVATSAVERPPHAPESGAMVHDAEDDWWSGAVEAVSEVLVGLDAAGIRRTSIAGIGVSGLFPAVVLLDGAGRPLSDAVLYGDARAQAAAAEVTRRLGVRLKGDEVSPRLVWLQEWRPGLVNRARHVLGPTGYVGWRLTGRPSIDPHSAARWGGIATPGLDGWDTAALAAIGLNASNLPPIVGPTEVIGPVTEEARLVTGLPAGIPVVAGTTDSLAGFIGDGLHNQGDAIVYYGSSGTLLVCSDDLDAVLRDRRRFGPDSPYRLAAYAVNSGVALERLRAEMLSGVPFETLDVLAAAVPPGADGVVMIPYLAGRSQPEPQPSAHGALIGLQLHHTAGHVWRAALEAFGFVLRDALERLDGPLHSVTAVGGGARSATWRGIVSDVTGLAQRHARPGGSARGAAMLAALGVGRYGSLAGFDRCWFDDGVAETTRPDKVRRARYDGIYTTWRAIEAAVAAFDADSTERST